MRPIDFRVVFVRRFRWLPPRLFASLMHLFWGGGLRLFYNPKTFSELLAAKNLEERDPLLPSTADKLAGREFIAERVGSQYLVPLQQWADSADEIDFDALRSPCVVKATHGCDMTLLVRKGDRIDQNAIKGVVRKWLDTDFSKEWNEWVYKDIPPRVIVEDFLGDGEQPPPDYKFFMFNGRTGMVQKDENRFVDHRTNMFDHEWRVIEVKGVYGPSDVTPAKPDNFDEMVAIAEKLAKGFVFVRIDMYEIDGRIYVGEITHFPGGGKLIFTPREFDRALGELWRLNTPIPSKFLRHSHKQPTAA